jgi:DNA polymerase III subunit alpha
MSYLKVHYPNYFYANILSNVIGSEKKTAAMIDDNLTLRYTFVQFCQY